MSNLVEMEKWLDKHGLADQLSCGVRWIEARIAEGMPSAMIAGRRKFKVSKVEPWLKQHGYWEDDDAAA